MKKDTEKKEMRSFAVIGMGRFGTELAIRLHKAGKEVLAIDDSKDRIDSIGDLVTTAACADATNQDILMTLGVQNMDCAVVAIGSDLEASVLITMNLKSIGVPYIICKANNEVHSTILEKLGADEVIIPEKEMAQKKSRILASNGLVQCFELAQGYSVEERKPLEAWIGKSVFETNIRAKYGLNVIAVNRDGKISAPTADIVLSETDNLFLFGSDTDLAKLDKESK